MSEKRFVDIETRIAHQEQQIEELNRVVTEHLTRIGRLEDACRDLGRRLRQLSDDAQGATSRPQDDRPPHY